MKMMLPA